MSLTKPGVWLVTSGKLNTRKVHTVCKTLAQRLISLPTPSQSGVYKTTMEVGKIKSTFYGNFKKRKMELALWWEAHKEDKVSSGSDKWK